MCVRLCVADAGSSVDVCEAVCCRLACQDGAADECPRSSHETAARQLRRPGLHHCTPPPVICSCCCCSSCVTHLPANYAVLDYIIAHLHQSVVVGAYQPDTNCSKIPYNKISSSEDIYTCLSFSSSFANISRLCHPRPCLKCFDAVGWVAGRASSL